MSSGPGGDVQEFCNSQEVALVRPGSDPVHIKSNCFWWTEDGRDPDFFSFHSSYFLSVIHSLPVELQFSFSHSPSFQSPLFTLLFIPWSLFQQAITPQSETISTSSDITWSMNEEVEWSWECRSRASKLGAQQAEPSNKQPVFIKHPRKKEVVGPRAILFLYRAQFVAIFRFNQLILCSTSNNKQGAQLLKHQFFSHSLPSFLQLHEVHNHCFIPAFSWKSGHNDSRYTQLIIISVSRCQKHRQKTTSSNNQVLRCLKDSLVLINDSELCLCFQEHSFSLSKTPLWDSSLPRHASLGSGPFPFLSYNWVFQTQKLGIGTHQL